MNNLINKSVFISTRMKLKAFHSATNCLNRFTYHARQYHDPSHHDPSHHHPSHHLKYYTKGTTITLLTSIGIGILSLKYNDTTSGTTTSGTTQETTTDTTSGTTQETTSGTTTTDTTTSGTTTSGTTTSGTTMNDTTTSTTQDTTSGTTTTDTTMNDTTQDTTSGTTIQSSRINSTYTIYQLIWNVCSPDWFLLLSITTITIFSAMINIQTPLMIGKLVSIVQKTLQSSSIIPLTASTTTTTNSIALKKAAIKLLSLFCAGGFLAFVDIYLVTLLGERLSIRIREKLYESLLDKPIEFYDARMASELVNRLGNDLAEFKHAFKQTLTSGLKSAIQSIGSIYALVQLSSSLTLTLATTLPGLYLFMNFYGSYLRKLSRIVKEKESASIASAGECLGNVRTVKAFVSEQYEVEKYINACLDASHSSSQLGFHIGLFQGLQNISIGSMVLLILYYGGQLVSKGEMSGGDLMSFMIAMQNTQKSLASIGVLVGQSIKATSAASRVFDFIDYETSNGSKKFYNSQVNCKGDIVFDNVSFSYPTRPDQPILDNFSITIPSGSVVALVGTSGSGKSTIGQLLERFYQPSSGTIYLGQKDVRDLSVHSLRKKIGLISQEPVLFATSIRENIRYGMKDASDLEVEKAAKEANCHDFIMEFPDGYDTLVGERGATLSGGQRQRIAIARALIKSPDILILDEATSALDTTSEKLVQQALDKSMKGRTVLVIAHRLSTIQKADFILVMGNDGSGGKVLESGTHQELLAKRNVYWNMYTQSPNLNNHK